MALPTNGRVVVDTTVGEIDIELWSKVCVLWLVEVRNIDTMASGRKRRKHAGIS